MSHDGTMRILNNYKSEPPDLIANLHRILSHGALGGTGKVIILPVDQGFEHGPIKSFDCNPDAYDPLYHFNLAVEGCFNAFAAPIGLLEVGAVEFSDRIPLILKLNSSNALMSVDSIPDQAPTAFVDDAVRLNCCAVGITIYPGSDASLKMFEYASVVIQEARAVGMPTIIWSYPRGGDLTKEDETALDVVSYSAHIAALLGAHIIKVKMPALYTMKNQCSLNVNNASERVQQVIRSSFNGRRIVIFSGGPSKSDSDILEDIRAIHSGGGFGSIIGRNSFQRKKHEALVLIKKIVSIYMN